MTELQTIRRAGAVLSLVVVWLLVVVVLAQKNRIDDLRAETAALRGDVPEIGLRLAELEERIGDAGIVALGEEVARLREDVGGFNMALRGLQLAIDARDRQER